jgi:hypothetical protein
MPVNNHPADRRHRGRYLLIGMNKNRDWEINYDTGGDVSKEAIADKALAHSERRLVDGFIKAAFSAW